MTGGLRKLLAERINKSTERKLKKGGEKKKRMAQSFDSVIRVGCFYFSYDRIARC